MYWGEPMSTSAPVASSPGLAEGLRDAEVEELDDLLVVDAREEDVGRLEVAVDDAGAVGAPERPADLLGDLRRLAQRQAPLALEPVAEVLAAEQLHHEVGEVAVDAVVEHLHDVRPAQARRRPGLPREARARVARARAASCS